MKKNISINVGGIIFHIEEDGYDELKDYLSAINRYFSTYEDSTEIIADIESRIAEIFLSKLSENKQVITQEDVNNLIVTMGKVSDFEAAEEMIDESYGEPASFRYQDTATQTKKTISKERSRRQYDDNSENETKKLYRDEKRKLIGGVCSGIAHYFNLDPLWIRMLFLLPFFDIFITFVAPWFIFAVYLAIWFFIPGSEELEEDENVKRLFRDSENSVLGGVASGVGSFFGIDINLVRLLFVALTFTGGVGFVIYLIIWFITPEAKSITERMQMKGEPITLSNIEQKIKDSLHFDEEDGESLLAKILLFPFRLIAKIIDSIGDDFGPIAKVLFTILSIFIGIILVLVSMGVTIGLVTALAVFFNTNLSQGLVIDGEIPLQMIQNSIPPVGVFFTFISVWIPFIFVGILGTCLIARQMVTKPVLNWGLLGIWVIGLIGAGVTVPLFLSELQSTGSFKENIVYEVPEGKLNIDINNFDDNDDITTVNLAISGHEKDEIELIERFESRGETRQNAIQNAKNINYKHIMEDASIQFDQKFFLKDDMPFRGQQVDMKLYIPYGKEFTLSENLKVILNENALHNAGYSHYNLGINNTWVFTEEGLKCLTCEESNASAPSIDREGKMVNFNFEKGDFSKLIVTGAFDIEVIKSDKYSLTANGEAEDLKQLKVEVRNGALNIRHKEKANLKRGSYEPLSVVVEVPELRMIQAEGALKCQLINLERREMRIKLIGAINCEADLDVDELLVEVTGASKLNLKGKGNLLKVGVMGTSDIDAANFIADDISVEALGISNAIVHATDKLEIRASETSNVTYEGKPENIDLKDLKDLGSDYKFDF